MLQKIKNNQMKANPRRNTKLLKKVNWIDEDHSNNFSRGKNMANVVLMVGGEASLARKGTKRTTKCQNNVGIENRVKTFTVEELEKIFKVEFLVLQPLSKSEIYLDLNRINSSLLIIFRAQPKIRKQEKKEPDY